MKFERYIIIVLIVVILCLYVQKIYYGEETRRTPIGIDYVEAHYETEESTYYRPPCFYDTYYNDVYVPDKYYVKYKREFTSGRVLISKYEVSKDTYEKIKKELELENLNGVMN